MPRRFREHDLRQVTDLTGFWDFAFLGDVSADKIDPAKIKFNELMTIPGCFDATPAFAGMRGLVAYHRRTAVCDTALHRLILDGVHHWCRIFVDGKHLMDHSGGFTRFNVDFVPKKAGLIDIVVLVDNRIDPKLSPLHLDYYDWYHFGGIARSVELQRLGSLWIDSLNIQTVSYARRKIKISLAYRAAGPAGKAKLEISCAGKTLRATPKLSPAGGSLEYEMDLPGTKLWSPQSPNLHELYVRLGDDDMRERVGIRQVQVKGPDILINGKKTLLLGFCRHEIHTQFGHGLPEAIMLEDLQQLRDMGCNFIRGSHYPQDVRFLDLCDEMGFCVWCETTGWGQSAVHFTDENFMAAVVRCAEEMVAGAANRPSVIMWAVFNEGSSESPAGRAAYQRVLGRIRELDPTRPLTFASNRPYQDICMDLADIVSVNMYPGWYSGYLGDIQPAIDKLHEHLKAVKWNKPLIISEIGAAGLYGYRDINNGKWTEQYQADLLERVIRGFFIDCRRASGISIWQFCDMRTSNEVAIRRARAFNNKGVLDEYRRPKLAYQTVKTLFKQIAKQK